MTPDTTATTPRPMRAWTLEPPTQWRAGYVGSEPNKQPFYHDCADCGAKAPPIAGIYSTDGTYSGIGVLKQPDGFFVRAAMFCASCWAKRQPAALQNAG